MDDDNYEPDPFDYDYLGPNSDGFNHSGFGGHGFDSDGEESDTPNKYFEPDEPDFKLADWKREDEANYDKIMECLFHISLNRNKRILRKHGESAGVEKIMQCIEADLDAGHCKLMNCNLEGKIRTCLHDFDPYTGHYVMAEDNTPKGK